MANYLVTGRAASGKSAVAEELSRRGLRAFDTDAIAGLSAWRNSKTHELVSLDDNTYVDLDALVWLWDKQVLLDFLRDKDNVFICGGADNDFDFEEYFAMHFVLDIKPTTQINHPTSRTTNDYGINLAMFPKIIDKQRTHIENAKRHRAIIVDAERPIGVVVDTIMEYVA